MLRINCPVCGLRDETEFTYGGDATKIRPAMDETDPKAWYDFVYLRDNPKGAHREYWHHALGCRQWLILERDTVTHETGTCRLARDVSPEERAIPATALQEASE